MDMEKKVRKITVVSDPEATYFLQIGWEKDLGKGFEVTLCDGHIAWVGAASEEDVSREAADMEMEQPKYVEELKKALITVAQPANKYSFDLVKDGDIPEMYYFTYEKKLKDVSFKLGSLRLKKAPNPAEITRQLINYCLNCTTELLSRNEHLLKENERLRSDWNYIHDKLEQFVNSKEELERDLYTKFTCVLNEKKAKIRSMNEKLSQTQQKVQEKSSSSIPFDTVPVAELTTDDYNGSTDDDRKISEVTKETASQKSSKRRPFVNTPDDYPDIAPSRKRRHRRQNVQYYTEVKDKLSQPEDEEKQREHRRKTKVWRGSKEHLCPKLKRNRSLAFTAVID
ncbi:DNA repair protein XRCC4 isoform X3 [Pseudophryne corroboree]|uniref:DNA repair protein XRCC4 isoform X3 n=1 Tax=Pseudophryne corroboree TaxID=495146 RepID=UPI003081A3A3